MAYESKNDEHIDGVISLTPVIIQKVLAYTGAVTLSDGTELNGDNATQMLQKDLYYKYLSSNSSYKISNANDYVDSLFAETAKIVMGKLVDDFDINRIADYSKIFTDGGKDRTILMWMEDETAESYVKAAGCSGALNDDPSNPEAGVFFSGANGSKLGWFVSLDTQIGDVTVNDDGSRTYDVTVTVSNDITRDDMYRAGNYIIGNYNGQVESYLHLFAPAGGTISDFETSNSMTMNMDEYHGLEVEEREASYMLEYGNGFVYVNNQGYMLEISSIKKELPILIGISTSKEDYKAGNRLNEEDLIKLGTVIKIMNSAQTNGIASLITKIDISNENNYTLFLETERKTAYLGDCSNLETRMLFLVGILEKEKENPGEIFINMNLNTDDAYFRESV